MGYVIPNDVEDRISELLSTGHYDTRDEVLRAAIDALERGRKEVAAIQEGIEDMQAGRVRPVRDFDREFRKQNDIA